MTVHADLRVEGLAELRRALRQVDPIEHRAELQRGLKRAAEVVADEARSRVPSRSGRAAGSIRAVSGGNRQYVVGGKKLVPYYGWLDFGSRNPVTGNLRSVGPWAGSGTGPAKGRFIYPALDAKRPQVVALTEQAIADTLRRAFH